MLKDFLLFYSQQNNVGRIAATILINQKGETIEKKLRGEELLNKLEELLNKK
jgi:hypothetical protein